MYKKHIEYDTRKAKLNILPSDWIKNKCNFIGFNNREIVLFRISHFLGLTDAVSGVYNSVYEYKLLSGLLYIQGDE